MLLEALADFEIATLLDHDLRLRIRCGLAVKEYMRGEKPDAAQRIAKFTADRVAALTVADPAGPGRDVVYPLARVARALAEPPSYRGSGCCGWPHAALPSWPGAPQE
jgi:hypothetical protein